jgi:hypothetical protein
MVNTGSINHMFNAPFAASNPIVNNRESPGNTNPKRTPDSIKIIVNNMKYIRTGILVAHSATGGCSTKSNTCLAFDIKSDIK